MAAKWLGKTALVMLAALLLSCAALALAAESEPIEYQDSVDIESLLKNAQSDDAAQGNRHFADASSAADVRAGLRLYKSQCSSCHGRQLQGQALWQAQDTYAGMRAPPHDETGHTWQHSDEDLFRKVRTGNMNASSEATVSAPGLERHAFAAILGEASILQILAFIKARWPLGIRIAQSTLNPQFQGMPSDAKSVEWTFPPTCLSSK